MTRDYRTNWQPEALPLGPALKRPTLADDPEWQKALRTIEFEATCFDAPQEDQPCASAPSAGARKSAEPADGWIEWAGVARPVAGHVRLEVRLRGGGSSRGRADDWTACWRINPQQLDNNDIIAYRILPDDSHCAMHGVV